MLALLGLFVLWSNSFHAIAWLRRDVDAWDLVLLRFAPVGAFCILWFFLSGAGENIRILRSAPLRIAWMGLLIVIAYNLFLNWGQGRVPAGTASLLIATNPFFTYLLALAVRQESPHWRKTAGVILSFIGVYLLLRSQGRAFGPGYGLYALSTLAAPLSWAIATVIGRPLVTRTSPVRVTYLSLMIGSLALLFLAPFDRGVRESVSRFAVTDWIALGHLIVPCTIVGFAVWYAALRRLPASSAAAFVLLNPPLTIGFGSVWGTDRPSTTVLVYGVWILGGVLLSTWRIPSRSSRPGSPASGVLGSARPSTQD